jgi:hypothetical protein
VVHGSGVVVAQMRVSDKTNEIPCVKPLLAELNISRKAKGLDEEAFPP